MKVFSVFSVLLLASCAAWGQEQRATLNSFDHAEYLQPGGEKAKTVSPVSGVLSFDAKTKSIVFTDKKGTAAFNIKNDAIKSMLYERSSRPRRTCPCWPANATRAASAASSCQGGGAESSASAPKNVVST